MSKPKFKSPSYQQSTCCGPNDCLYGHRATADQPCWGLVEVCAEDGSGDEWWWIHACQGHLGIYEGWSEYQAEQISKG